jgi:hypothetical protein
MKKSHIEKKVKTNLYMNDMDELVYCCTESTNLVLCIYIKISITVSGYRKKILRNDENS